MNNTTISASEWNSKPTFVHLRNNEKSTWHRNIYRHFPRLPVLGEEIATDDDFYVVEAVIHLAFDEAEFSAEVYARKIEEPSYMRLLSETTGQ